MEYTKDLKRAHQMSVILYLAFLVSLGVYVVVVEILKTNLKDFQGVLEGYPLSWVRYVLYSLALVQVFIIRFVRQILTRGLTGTEMKALIAHLQRVSILTAAFCEAPAIFGLVLFFLTGGLRDFHILTAMSFVLFFLYFPRYSNWEEWITSRIRS